MKDLDKLNAEYLHKTLDELSFDIADLKQSIREYPENSASAKRLLKKFKAQKKEVLVELNKIK